MNNVYPDVEVYTGHEELLVFIGNRVNPDMDYEKLELIKSSGWRFEPELEAWSYGL